MLTSLNGSFLLPTLFCAPQEAEEMHKGPKLPAGWPRSGAINFDGGECSLPLQSLSRQAASFAAASCMLSQPCTSQP